MRHAISTNAIMIVQGNETPVISFFMKGQDILRIADISRIEKSREGALLGYQRGEVLTHVKEIVDYLDSEKIIFPNAIILAMSSEVDFKKHSKVKHVDNNSTSGQRPDLGGGGQAFRPPGTVWHE